MFFPPQKPTDIKDSSEERKLLQSLEQEPTDLTYPVYVWKHSCSANREILSDPEKTLTNDFNYFLKAFESLRHSVHSSLAIPTNLLVKKQLEMHIIRVNNIHAGLNVMLVKKKIEIFKSEMGDKAELIKELTDLQESSNQALDAQKQGFEMKLAALSILNIGDLGPELAQNPARP